MSNALFLLGVSCKNRDRGGPDSGHARKRKKEKKQVKREEGVQN